MLWLYSNFVIICGGSHYEYLAQYFISYLQRIMPVKPVPETINFPAEEGKVLEHWKKIDAFQSSIKQSKNRPRYTFYDGPPFATGLPHYGHILAGTVKDIVTRWAHQSGFHVERRFGWDCHGLPVEYEIDKTLGIKGPEDVEKMGIAKYNSECRKIVTRYAQEWEEIMTRLGRWIDFRNDYKTMYPSFMESVWWAFKQLFNKGLVYRGFKVMPFSTACNTPLSNFEAGQNYKDVTDPAVVVSFPLEEDANVAILAWTTTPWTLPSNVALCVHPDSDYVKVKEVASGKVYILMQARLSSLYKTPEDYEILQTFKGSTLEGKKYVPLFDYFLHMKERGGFKVLTDTYVTESSGTGVVHQAPYFGEDDYRVSLKYGIITKDMEPICPLDFCGRFVQPVKDFVGQYVKDADKNIIRHLKEKGRLVRNDTTTHSYPFCWRSDTPLIYRAVPSWFVRVEHMTDKLLESNSQTYWVPEFVKEKRFGNWLKDARDWAISRNRYWGTPIPLWVSDDGEEIVCVGSKEELEQLSGVPNLTDLHREFIDQLTIPSRTGKGVLRRVTEVFDCWFESGSMPYAQNHYPFENQKDFEDGFPGDFIAEGIDQTRGWFYTLVVLGTALYGKAPFKNLICHGLVLAEDGQKMSKRKKNYPDPMDIVANYGADAIRLYLINSPVVRADNLCFKEKGVKDILKDVFLPWYNAYRFLVQCVDRLEKEDGVEFLYNDRLLAVPDNYMDQWILSFTQSLIKFVSSEMAAYRLYTVVPQLIKFVEELTNWYVRMNRRRLKGDSGQKDCQQALTTLFSVLFAMTKVMAPFIPFLTEHMYQNLRSLLDPEMTKNQDTESVHFLLLPQARDSLINTAIEKAVARLQTVVELGRIVRDRNTLPMKYPLKEIVIIHTDDEVLKDIRALSDYLKEELNVRTVTVSNDKHKYGVQLKAEPDHKVLGARLKGAFKAAMDAIRLLTDDQLTEFQRTGQLEVAGQCLTREDLRLMYTVNAAADKSSAYEAHSDNEILVLLDVSPDQSMVDEGLAREVINRIQKLRKKAKLVPTDEVTVFLQPTGGLVDICRNFATFIYSTIKQPLALYPVTNGAQIIVEENNTIKADNLNIALARGHVEVANLLATTGCDAELVNGDASPSPGGDAAAAKTKTAAPAAAASNGPVCRYVNVELVGDKPAGGCTGTQATILLENPRGDFPISLLELKRQVAIIFGLAGKSVTLYASKDMKSEIAIKTPKDIFSLHGASVYASVSK